MKRLGKSGFDNLVGADALRADAHSLDFAVDNHTDILKIGAECTLGVLDDVETDATLFLRQTTVGDVAADSLMLAAYFTNSAHRWFLFCIWKVIFGMPFNKKTCAVTYYLSKGSVQRRF